MHMIMFVLDDPALLDDVLDAWDTIGVSGVTIIESTGINRRRVARQVGAPFMAGINRLISSDQENHYTLITIVNDEGVVDACINAAEKVVGDLCEPNTGVLAAWPLSTAAGVPTQGKKHKG
ncbi:MAG: hypothetical protein JW726_12535 [Anaerolineales bacterium]|nr:hypothetical protein [Anaerolineales bacterium]